MYELLDRLVERISPHNGLVVNADVWAKAHGYHQAHHQAHLLYGHGPGIITGLETHLVDGEKARLSVQSGLALDPLGRIIVHDKPDSVLVGATQPGLLYIYLQAEDEENNQHSGRTETRPAPYYVRLGYKFNSGFSLPGDAVELARIRLEQPEAPIKTALHPAQPGPNELDLRFRTEVGINPSKAVWLAISYVGAEATPSLPRFERRAGELARAIGHLLRRRVWIDEGVRLDQGVLEPYTLLYIIEQGGYDPEPVLVEALQTYLAGGGTLLVESLVENSPMLNRLASEEMAFIDDLEPLLGEPFLFSAPPPGARDGDVRLAEGVIFSTCDYGRVWQRRDPATSRETIRAATEWAANLVCYALTRRPA